MKDMYTALSNSPYTVLSNSIDNVQTNITVDNVIKLPQAPTILVIGTNRDTAETVKVISINNNVLTVERGFDNTTPRFWGVGEQISRNFTAYDHNAFVENINNLNTDYNIHNHDNRYYEKNEVYSKLESNSLVNGVLHDLVDLDLQTQAQIDEILENQAKDLSNLDTKYVSVDTVVSNDGTSILNAVTYNYTQIPIVQSQVDDVETVTGTNSQQITNLGIELQSQSDAISIIDGKSTENTNRISINENNILLNTQQITDNYSSVNNLIEQTESNLQSQIDNSITYWSEYGDPTLTNKPFIYWTTNEIRDKHIDDKYIDLNTGKNYVLKSTTSIDPGPDGILDTSDDIINKSYFWEYIENVELTNTTNQALNALNLADKKGKMFQQVDEPISPIDGYIIKNNDIWIKPENTTYDGITYKTNKLYSYNNGVWEILEQNNQLNDAKIEVTNNRITSEVTRIDGNIDQTLLDAQLYTDSEVSTVKEELQSQIDGAIEYHNEHGVPLPFGKAKVITFPRDCSVNPINVDDYYIYNNIDLYKVHTADNTNTSLDLITFQSLADLIPSSTYPADTWLDNNTRDVHIADIFIDIDTGISYRYSKDVGVYKWIEVTDSQAAEALNKAQLALDERNRIILSYTKPIGTFNHGDVWIKPATTTYENTTYNASKMYMYNTSLATPDWVSINDENEIIYSKITQNANEIDLRVRKDDVINSINISTEGIGIDATKLDVSAEDLTITINGTPQNLASNVNSKTTLSESESNIKTKLEGTSSGWNIAAENINLTSLETQLDTSKLGIKISDVTDTSGNNPTTTNEMKTILEGTSSGWNIAAENIDVSAEDLTITINGTPQNLASNVESKTTTNEMKTILEGTSSGWNIAGQNININGNTDFTNLKESSETKNTTYNMTTPPTGTDHNIGDRWFDTDNDNMEYYWNGSTWAETKGSLAERTKSTIFRQTSTPSEARSGDLWYDTDNNNYLRIYNGTIWEPAQTKIDGGLITTGKIQSPDGQTYFDLDNDELVLADDNTNVKVNNNQLNINTNDLNYNDIDMKKYSCFAPGVNLSGGSISTYNAMGPMGVCTKLLEITPSYNSWSNIVFSNEIFKGPKEIRDFAIIYIICEYSDPASIATTNIPGDIFDELYDVTFTVSNRTATTNLYSNITLRNSLGSVYKALPSGIPITDGTAGDGRQGEFSLKINEGNRPSKLYIYGYGFNYNRYIDYVHKTPSIQKNTQRSNSYILYNVSNQPAIIYFGQSSTSLNYSSQYNTYIINRFNNTSDGYVLPGGYIEIDTSWMITNYLNVKANYNSGYSQTKAVMI